MQRTLSLLLLAMSPGVPLLAQAGKHASHELDLAVGYTAQRQALSGGNRFWEQGGSGEVAVDLFRGLGAEARVTGGHASRLGGSTVDLTTITTTIGPRYTWRSERYAVFADATFGESSAFNTVFPSSGGPVSAANSFAVEAGGGVDLSVSRHFALRVLQASWLRTQFPNGAGNAQNTLQLGAGIVMRLH